MSDNYFELIPKELTELILLSAFEDISILDLKETGLFDNLLYDIQFWKKVYAEYELPVFNVNVKIILESKKVDRLTEKLFNIIALDNIKLFTALVDYKRLIENNNILTIDLEHIDLSILYDHINIPDLVIELLFDRSTMLHYMNTQHVGDIRLIINTKIMESRIKIEYLNYNIAVVPNNPTKFIKDIIMWLSYHRYKINIKSLK